MTDPELRRLVESVTQLEDALAASQGRLRLLAERGQEVVYRMRTVPNRLVEYVSPAVAALTGYTPEEFYADPDLWLRLVHPEDRGLVGRDPPERSGDEWPTVARWVRRDGSILTAEHRSVPVLDAQGAPVAIEGVARDVTSRVEAEARLRSSEARFRELLAQIDLCALLLDASGKVLSINVPLLKLLGLKRDQILGRDWIELAVPERDRLAARQALHDAIASGLVTGSREEALLTSSDEQRRLIWTSVIQRDTEGEVVGLASIGHDVTELHRVEGERLLLAAAVEQTAEAIIVMDPTADIVFVNPAFQRVSGYTREEVIGHVPRFLQAGTQDPAAFEAMWTTLRAGSVWQGELTNRRKDGTKYTDAVTITPVFDVAGALSAYVSVQRDVSHVREVEAELILEARVRGLLGEAIQAALTTSSLEQAAQAVCNGLASLPGIHVVNLVAFLGDEDAVVIARCGPEGLPLNPGDRLPQARARYLQKRAASGPWGERPWPDDGVGGEVADGLRGIGVQALAFGPIGEGDHIAGVLIVGTQDRRYGSVVADKMPPLVGFGASANTLLVERLHARRREHHLRGAFEAVLMAHAFSPVFQPIVELETGEPMGYEALTRFDSGEAPQARFADAWSVGIGLELEAATLEAALVAARGLPAGRWIDLNVSPRLLDSSEQLASLLRSADRPVVIEITEHEPISNYAAVREAAAALGGHVRLAVDDAGVGIANFGHIIELRPDLVKLDITLVRRVNADLGRQALVVAMRHFARTAGCRLVAEGIETEEEAHTLKLLGVEFGQGNWFGRPEPVEHWSDNEAAATS